MFFDLSIPKSKKIPFFQKYFSAIIFINMYKSGLRVHTIYLSNKERNI